MADFILALDQGTTSSRALVIDAEGSILSVAQKEFPQHFPKPGWVEHDPEEIWASVVGTMRQALGEAGVARFLDAAGASQGDLLLVIGGAEEVVLPALGVLRLQLGRDRDLIPEGRHDFVWITDFPLLDYSVEDDKWNAVHHPFTRPLAEDMGLLEEGKLAEVRADAYDVVLVVDVPERASAAVAVGHRRQRRLRVRRRRRGRRPRPHRRRRGRLARRHRRAGAREVASTHRRRKARRQDRGEGEAGDP